MNRWAREESSSSPPIRRIAGRIWASSTCWPTRFCTSTIFRSEKGYRPNQTGQEACLTVLNSYGPSYQTRGNVTGVNKWLNTANNIVSTINYQFDDAGNVLLQYDPLMHPTRSEEHTS